MVDPNGIMPFIPYLLRSDHSDIINWKAVTAPPRYVSPASPSTNESPVFSQAGQSISPNDTVTPDFMGDHVTE